MEQPTCATCKWWEPPQRADSGICLVATYDGMPDPGESEHANKTVAVPLMIAGDASGYQAWLHTKPTFYCIHHESTDTTKGI